MIRVGMGGIGFDFINKASVSSGRALRTPRSLPLSGGGGRRRLAAAAAAGVLAPTAREREPPSWRTRRGDRTEHAQLGGRTAEELAASALRSASPGFRSRRARSPGAPAPGPALGRILAREGAPPGPLSRSRAASSASTSPKVAVLVAWAGNLTCAGRVDGRREGGREVILQGNP